jgi:ABC-2 type transport system ATP-binding protein
MSSTTKKTYAVSVKNLSKTYGKLEVLKKISFNVEQGSIIGILGPNGAGKTTTVRILTTLLKPDSGSAEVNGFSVLEEPLNVKKSIGLTSQYASIDELLTGMANLVMIGRLSHLTPKAAKERAEYLLERFKLTDAAHRLVKTYSGGMRRRLDLAASLLTHPPIIFLDEPTTGLDPQSRIAMWEIIRELQKGGSTIVLTTQYLEEADQLADKIVVIDHGKIIAEGSPKELKHKMGGDRYEFVALDVANYEKLLDVAGKALHSRHDAELSLQVNLEGSRSKFDALLAKILEAGIKLESFSQFKPSLDDVFLELTGNTPAPATEESNVSSK